LIYMEDIPLTREEKEKKVCELYRKGKSVREISKALHMSFSDIGAVKRKYFDTGESREKETKLSKRSQALKLFQAGKSNLEISIQLDLSADEVLEIREQYLTLVDEDKFFKIYKEIKHDIRAFLELYEAMKSEELTPEDAAFAVSDKRSLTEISFRYWSLIKQVSALNEELDRLAREKEELIESVDFLEQKNDGLLQPTNLVLMDHHPKPHRRRRHLNANNQEENFTSF
jgi:DNA-binding CsgD family transcriptional regulator